LGLLAFGDTGAGLLVLLPFELGLVGVGLPPLSQTIWRFIRDP
jgi:hypothetical protein